MLQGVYHRHCIRRSSALLGYRKLQRKLIDNIILCVALKVWREGEYKERQRRHGLRPDSEERTRFHCGEVCFACRPVFLGQTCQASTCAHSPRSLKSDLIWLSSYFLRHFVSLCFAKCCILFLASVNHYQSVLFHPIFKSCVMSVVY